MLENVSNPGGFLRTSRNFPASDVKQLATEIDKSYINIASVVNTCTRGMFPTTMPAITGEEWFITGNQKQQSLRQVYQIPGSPAIITGSMIPHGLNIQSPNQFKRCWGSYTDGTGAYGLVWGDSVTVAGLITFYVTMTQIIFNVGAGVPAMTSGTVILEWLAQP